MKNVERHAFVKERHESTAEHTFSCLILADYLMTRFKFMLDKQRVFELLLYHDIVEIEAGDIPIHHEEKRIDKANIEKKAMKKLKEQIPVVMKDIVAERFDEFEQKASPEAKFAKAVDGFDAMIHELDYKADWKGWNEEMLRKYYGERFFEVPEIKSLFEQVILFIKKNKYI